ncbi:hypothetical protein OQA88_1274 [Cercophora sp. LCS_1]
MAEQRQMMGYESGLAKLRTLAFNVVRSDTNKGWTRNLSCFVDRGNEKPAVSDYKWADFNRWLRKRFKYSPETHRVISVQDGMTTSYEVDEAAFYKILEGVARGTLSIHEYSDLYFYLDIRNTDPLTFPDLDKLPGIEWLHDESGLDSEQSDEGDDAPPGPSRAAPTPPPGPADVGGAADAADPGPSASGAATPQPEPFDPNDTSGGAIPEINVENLTLADDAADDYRIKEAQDDDFGAIDDSYVDTYVGNFNASDNKDKWDECTEFFRLPNAVHPRATGGRAAKRVPLAKLPGMTVGLFDYQFIAVLKLLRLSLDGVHGGLLADEQGLGKTQEMFGLIALANNLRRCKNEVLSERRAKKPTKHAKEGATAKTCFADRKYGFKCYCYHKPTQQLADKLPEGPSVILAPARSCAQVLAEAKAKLDTSALKLRLMHDTAHKDDKLTKAEVKTLTAAVTATKGADGSIRYNYKVNPGLSDYVIITSPDLIERITGKMFGVEVKVGDETKIVSGLLPGMVLMDEFHEYALAADSPVITWLEHLKASSRGKHPLMYFVSGTPFGDSPADIRSAVSLLGKPEWATDPNHAMANVTVAALNKLTATFENLTRLQSEGVVLEPSEIAEYRIPLYQILKKIMVRRLGVDKFRDRPLTDIGSLSVKIADHPVPTQYIDALKTLTDEASARAAEAARNVSPTGEPWAVGRFLRSDHSQDVLLKLRLATTFPGIAPDAAKGTLKFEFTTSEVIAELEKADRDVKKTAYFPRIPEWAAHSPKLATMDATIATMLADKKRIEGEASHAKKLVIFCPLEAEALLVCGYLLLRIATQKKKNKKPVKDEVTMKPVWLHSALSETERHGVIRKFLEPGNAPPNILVAPLALAGTGLNLQRANYSIVTGPAWTKRETQQAYYRIHRVGQKQQTKLQLLTAKWNPADRVILAKYEGKEVSFEDQIWEISNEFGGDSSALVERHQQARE